MKIRTDFVTNSSSSSFILAFKDTEDFTGFKSTCNLLSYEEFYKLIISQTNDYLVFCNNTKEPIKAIDLIDLIKKYDFGINVKMQFDKLEDCVIQPYEMIDITINDYSEENEYIDIESIGFEDMYEDDFSIYVIDNKENRNKQTCIDMLKNYYSIEYKNKLIREKIKAEDFENTNDYYKKLNEYSLSEEVKQKVEEYLKTTDFEKNKERIENSLLVVQSTIYDTSGGLLEWAIRNGFIEDNFYKNCLMCFNIG